MAQAAFHCPRCSRRELRLRPKCLAHAELNQEVSSASSPLDRAGDAVEQSAEIRTEGCDRREGDESNQGNEQSILDHGRTFFVARYGLKRLKHFVFPYRIAIKSSSPDNSGRCRLSTLDTDQVGGALPRWRTVYHTVDRTVAASSTAEVVAL